MSGGRQSSLAPALPLEMIGIMTAPESTRVSAWPERLDSGLAIARHVSDLSPYEICEEQVEEMYFGYQAKLRWTPISDLRLGPADSNGISKKRQKACNSKPVETMPPLLADEGVIMDGSHRYRTLVDKGCTHCWVYHIEVEPEPELTPISHKARRDSDSSEPSL